MPPRNMMTNDERAARFRNTYGGGSGLSVPSAGEAGRAAGQIVNAASSVLPRAGMALERKVVQPIRGKFAEFGSGFLEGSGLELGGAEAAQPMSPAEYDTDQENSDERALNDPMSGNPNRSRFADMHPPVNDGGMGEPVPRVQARTAFGENLYGRAGPDGRLNSFTNVTNENGAPQFADEFMNEAAQQAFDDNVPEYTGGANYGAPGSSGMAGPGGTVNIVPSEAFTGAKPSDVWDAAAGRARRDFQLRAEGNAHLASDATPAEIRAGKAQEIRQQMQNLNLGTDQSLGSLAANRTRYRQLSQELGNIQREEELGIQAETERAKLQAESRENALDRASEERKAVLENTLGGMPSGRTMEAIRNQIATQGYNSLSKDKKMLFEQDVRETLVENSLTEMTPEQLDDKVKLILGELSTGPKQVGRTLDGRRVQIPENVFKALKKAYNENPDKPKTITLRGHDGSTQYWTLDPETQRPMQVEGPQ